MLYLLHFVRMEYEEAQKIANERKREKMEEKLARWVTQRNKEMLLKVMTMFICSFICFSFHLFVLSFAHLSVCSFRRTFVCLYLCLFACFNVCFHNNNNNNINLYEKNFEQVLLIVLYKKN